MTDSSLSDTVQSGETTIPAPAAASSFASARSTVLPHVEFEGGLPRLSPAQRDRYLELRPLGAGAMGEVLLLKDNDIQREVAVKRLTRQTNAAEVLRFVEEIRTVGQLEHPNIVPVHDVGIDDQGRYFFVMKRLDGHTLQDVIDRLKAGEPEMHQRFDFSARVELIRGVLNAISYTHAQGYIHRDLKPANIMVGPYGEVTVMDWGLAKRIRAPRLRTLSQPETESCAVEQPAAPLPSAADASVPRTPEREALKTQAGALMGTPLYMCPEQARGQADRLDERSDLYSVAVIAHELLFLSHYLEGRTVAQVLEGVQTVSPDPHSMPRHPAQGHVPAELGWFIDKGLKKAPAERYQSAERMLAALDRTTAGTFPIQCQRTLIKRVLLTIARAADSHPMVALVLGTVGIGLLVATVTVAVRSLL